MTNVPAQ